MTKSRGWKRSVEQVPLKMFHYYFSGLARMILIVLVSISTWVTLPGRPLSLGSAGTPPPSWSPVSSCPFYCISSVFSSVFLLGSRLVLFWYNSAMLVKALARSRFSVFKGFLVRTQVQVQEVGRSVLPGGPAAVKVSWSLHLKLWTSEENTTRSTCRHSRALHRWAAPSRGSRRCGPAFSSLNVVLIILWDPPGTTCIL